MENIATDNKNHYRSVLIAPKKIDVHNISIGFPWKSDAICFNFNMPEEMYLWKDAEQLSDPDDIVTLVLDGNVPDLSFVSRMVRLKQLYIYNNRALSDLSFIENLPELNQLLINESQITSLVSISSLIKKKQALSENEQDIWKKLTYLLQGVFINSVVEPDGLDEIFQSDMYIEEIIINGKRRRKPSKSH